MSPSDVLIVLGLIVAGCLVLTFAAVLALVVVAVVRALYSPEWQVGRRRRP